MNAKQALRGTAGAVDSPEAALVELLLLSRAYAASNQHDLGAGFVNSLTIAVGGPWDDFFQTTVASELCLVRFHRPSAHTSAER